MENSRQPLLCHCAFVDNICVKFSPSGKLCKCLQACVRAKTSGNKQQLVNMVSKRVRELNAGSRPMVETDLSMGLADVALAEIAAGKLGTEVFPVIEGEEPQIG